MNDLDTSLTTIEVAPIEKVRELIEIKNLTYEDAGKLLGVTKQAIHDRCKRHGIKRNLNLYKNNKADILASKQRMVINSLTEDDIKKSSAYQKVGMYGILHERELITKGQATAIVDHRVISAKLSDVREELDRLRRQAGYQTRDDNEEAIEIDPE